MRRYSLLFLFTLATAAWAQTPLDHAELPLARGKLLWSAGQGLTVLLDGQTVFRAPGSEFVLHDKAWTTQLFNSSKPTSAKLEQRGAQQVLTVVCANDKCQATQVITAGPGDHCEIAWRWTQDGWDDAALQLACGKPAESFFAGSAFEALVGQRTVSGTIPAVYSDKAAHPVSGAARLTVKSLFGTAVVTSTRPMTLYDYKQRHGAFWLGCDVPVPRGQEDRCTFTVDLAPPDLVLAGVRVTGVRFTDPIVDGQATVALKLAAAGGPRKVRLEAELRGVGQSVKGESAAELSEAAQDLEVRLPALTPGSGELVAVLKDAGDGRELVRLPVLPVTVQQALAVSASRSFYTTEPAAALYVRVRPELAGRALAFSAAGGKLNLTAKPVPGERTTVAFAPEQLAEGATDLACRLTIDGRVAAEATVPVRKLADKPNQVKIDYAGRGLIIDGLPTLPCGFYVQHPATDIAGDEAPYGITHLAPYRNSRSAIDSDERLAEMIAAFDRYAALGLRVHFDVRRLTCAADSPEKWAQLKREVEAVREHPALLGYYLADEPELQGIPPERLAAAYRFVKDLDPYHPCSQVFADRFRAARYLGGMDIIMNDPYPIPNSPVVRVAEATRYLDEAIGSSIPLWIVPQAFGGGEWWGREPSPDEERVMTYLALIHGATGIQWFIRERAHVRPLPALLNACRDLAGEIAELTPALVGEQRRPAVQCADEALHCGAWRTDDALWVLVANTLNQPRAVQVTLPGAPDGAAEVLFKGRTATVAAGTLNDWIDGFGTRAYRLPLKAENPHERIDPANVVRNPDFEEQHVLGSPDGYYLGGKPDPGAQVRVDSRLAKHGRHSLRLVVPADGQGYSLAPFPVPLKAGTTYRVSLWARSLRPGAKLQMAVSGLTPRSVTCELTSDWREYELVGKAAKDDRRGQIGYSLTTAGTAWVDLLQMVPVTR